MKEIKTVICPIEAAKEFDNLVNHYLLHGWKVIKRSVISAHSEPNDIGCTVVVKKLYAELERRKPLFEEVTE